MKSYSVELNGRRVQVQAATPEAASVAAAEYMQANPKVGKPGVAEDVLRSAGTGLMEGVTAIPGLIGDAQNLVGRGADYVAERTMGAAQDLTGSNLGAKYMGSKKPREVIKPTNYAAINGDKTSGELNEMRQNVLGKDYQPQTVAGQFARAAGNMAPNALIPGSAAARAVNVLAPAVASEGAAQAVRALGGDEGAQGAARVLGGVLGGAGASIRPRGRVPINEAAGLDSATEALTEAGIDIRHVSTTSMGQMRDLIRRGRNPREAALSVVSTTDLPVPVPMTRGQRSGQPGQQLSENLMLRGARGSAASRQMRGLAAEQQDALRGNTAAIADTLAGGPAPTRGAGGAAVSERLNSLYDEAKTGVDAAYDAARASGEGARLPLGQAPVLGSRLRESVATYDLQRVPAVARELDRIDNIAGSGAVTVRDLFDARARLSTLRVSSDSIEAGAARSAARALDSHIDEAVTNDLFTGDPKAVGAWREAIAKRRNFGQLFESGDLVEALTERAPRGGEQRALRVDPNDATNYILGRSDLGFVGRQNLHRDLGRLEEVLGPQSAEWNGIRAEMFQRLASQGEGAVEFGARQFSGVKFQKGWQDFQRKDPQLAARMYTPEERAQIDRFAAVASRVTSSVRGGDNPSNSAVTAMRLLGNLGFLRGLPFVKGISDELEVQISLSQARKATAQTVGRAPPSPRPAPTANALARPAAVGAASAIGSTNALDQQVR